MRSRGKRWVSLLLTQCMRPPRSVMITQHKEPVKVSTQQELCNALEGNDDVILTDDIALTGNWTQIPIYSGTLDGNGHTISGLNVSSDSFYCGLMGMLFSGGHIKNLNIIGTVVSSYPYSTACTGGFAGVNQGTIENCSFYGSVIQSQGDNQAVGGIVGRNEKTGTITGCNNYGDISGISSGGTYDAVYVGGIAGTNHGSIIHCVNHGIISGAAANSHTYVGVLWGSTKWKSNGGYVGGIAGDTKCSDVTDNSNCNSGTVVGADNSNQVKLVLVIPTESTTVPASATREKRKVKLPSSTSLEGVKNGTTVIQWKEIRLHIAPTKTPLP